jgi:nucleoside-diphosphate-sugar epimerase
MYLVTGGGGFVGSHLARALVQKGEKVRIIDNSSTGSRLKVKDILNQVEWIDGDIRDLALMKQVCKGVEVVLHHAAVASVQASIDDPIETDAVNVGGTLNVLTAAKEVGVRRVVFAASAAIYGNNPITPKQEDLLPSPLSPYGLQKLSAEWYCRIWHSIYGLETVALRYFNIYGPRQDPNGQYAAVVPRFITAIVDGKSPEIYGDGEQSRDFISIRDIVRANLCAATAPNAPGKTFNIATGQSFTLNLLVDVLREVSGKPITPIYTDPKSGDIRESLADVTAAREILGFTAQMSLRDGLRETYQWFRDN